MGDANPGSGSYFLQPDYQTPAGAISKAAVPTCELQSDLQSIPFPAVIGTTANQVISDLHVNAQLTRRKFYFSFVFDQVAGWVFDLEVSFQLNNSVQMSVPMHLEDIRTRNSHLSPADQVNVGCLLLPTDRPIFPFWVDTQIVDSVVAWNALSENEMRTDVPTNQCVNMQVLRACSPINDPDTLWYTFCSKQENNTAGLPVSKAVVYYTVVMYPYHLDIMCDRITTFIRRGTFVPEVNVTNKGLFVLSTACLSSRY